GLANLPDDGLAGANGVAEVAADGVGEKAKVLDVDWLGEAELVAETLEFRLRPLLPEEGLGHVARDEVHPDEDEDADAEEDGQELQDAAGSVLRQGSGPTISTFLDCRA